MKALIALERKYIPRIRFTKLYVIVKVVVMLPYILFLLIKKLLSKKVKQDSKAIVLENIVKGFSNLIFNDPEVELLATQRAKICALCPYAEKSGIYSIIIDNKTTQIQGMKCGRCGCNLSAKVRSVADSCPINKW